MSQHCGYCVEVTNLRPHTNADRLQIATFFGSDTCVGLDIVKGEIGIYFPSDLQLSEEFCVANHLCRKKPDGTPDTGYLDPEKRNIKPIKLRGEKSDGIFMSISCLEYTGVNLDDINIGDTITVVNGHEICKKYIPRGRARNNSAKSKGNKACKKRAPVAPLFTEHADTEQLAYNLGAFKPGDEIEITLKMHGCFVKGTKIRMADNSLKAIESIKTGDRVLGYDFNQHKVVPTTVLHTFKNAPSNKWNKIRISRNYMRGDKRGSQISTWNHRYWVNERQEWVMAKDLMVGEKISTLFPSPVLTELQKEIAIGQFLGDGCLLAFGDRVAEIQESKKEDDKEYLEYIKTISSGWFDIYQDKKSGYDSHMFCGRSARSADLYNYLKDSSTFKNIPKEQRLLEGIIEKITPLSLAIWYMGDGSLAHTDNQQDRALLAICRYDTEADQAIIKSIFAKFELYPIFYKDSNGYNRLRFNLNDANHLFDIIAPYIPPCMEYKIPDVFKGRFSLIEDFEIYNPSGYVLSEQEILENTEVNEIFDEYDLETELHNYIVGLSIVHNTSQRTAHLPVLKEYKRTIWDKLLGREGTPIYDWGYVSGTRRTVLDDWDGGFYGSNAFRKQHHDKFVGKLLKNESCYYEVVGFTDNGTSIMGKGNNKKLDKDFVKQYGEETIFSYGCFPDSDESPQSDIYVYRMTITNEDGDVVEYSPDFMRYRCEQMGVKCVPEFVHEFIPDQGGLDSMALTAGEYVKGVAEQYYDGPDPIGKTHVREGVVVRIINRPKFCAYKHKNYSFKMLEGLIKESAAAPDMEEAEEVPEDATYN